MVLHTSGNLINPQFPIGNLLANTTYTFTVTPFYNNNPEYYETIQITTLAVIGSFDVRNIYETSVEIAWDRLAYAYNHINISWINTNLLQYYYSQPINFNNKYVTGQINNVPSSSNTITGLIPNNPYFFSITAYNTDNIPTPSITTPTIITLATVSPITCNRNDTTTSAIKLSWLGSATYTTLNLYWTPTLLDGASGTALTSQDLANDATNPILNPYGVASNIGTSNYTVRNLNPNTTYNFALFPYNSAHYSSSNPSTFQWTTEATLSGVYITNITNNSVRVNWTTGNYYSVSVYTLINRVIQQQTLLIRNTYVDIYNLLPNTIYQFKVIPLCKQIPNYNYDMRGIAIYTDPITTLATVGPVSITSLTNANLILNWGAGTYTSLNLYYYSSNNYQTSNIYNIANQNSANSNILSILIPQLYGNMQYTFNLYPINSFGASNISSNISIITLPSIPFLSLSSTDQYAISSNSMHLQWGSDNIYHSFTSGDIYWSIGTPALSNTYIGSNLGIFTSDIIINNLQINTPYKFKLIPYNNNHVPGNNLYLSQTTFASLSNLISSNITVNSVDFSWIPNYTSLIITYYPSTNPYAITTLPAAYPAAYPAYTSNLTVTNLSADTNYIFKFSGINSSNAITNNPVSINIITIPNVNSINIGLADITPTSIRVNWDMGSIYEYINLSIIQNNTIINTYYIQKGPLSYTINNLPPNTSYRFSIKPYNLPINTSNTIQNQLYSFGNTIYSDIIYTQSYIATASVISYSATNIVVSWSPANTYNNVYLVWTDQNGNSHNKSIVQNGYTIQDNSIYPNTQYNITVNTYNNNDISGVSLNALLYYPTLNLYTNNIITKPYAGQNIVYTANTTSLNISWGPVQSFAYVTLNLYDNLNNLQFNVVNYQNNSYIFNNLISNATYTVAIIPYNSAIIPDAGDTLSSSITTLATVGAISIPAQSLTDTSVTIQWGTGTYSKITIEIQDIASATLYETLYCPYSSSCNVTNLISNRRYQIRVYPDNSTIIQGTQLPQGTPSIANITTLATVQNYLITNVGVITTNIQWSGGTYNAISIQWTDKTHDITNPNIINPDASLSSYQITGLLPNTSNIFRLVPYNIDNILSYNTSLSTIPIVTLATITNIQIRNITHNSASILINNGTLSSEYLSYNLNLYNNDTLRVTSQFLNIYGCNLNITSGIVPNNNYNIVIIPYNSNIIPNTSYVYPLSFTSLAILGTIYTPTITTSSIYISWDVSNSSYSVVSWSPPSINNSSYSPIIYSGNYTITGLSPNINYNIKIVPYNRQNVPNNVYYDSTVITTYAHLQNVTSNVAVTTFTVGWDTQGYSNVLVQIYAVTMNIATNIATNTITGNTYTYPAQADKQYSVILQPSNNNGILSDSQTVSIYTLPIIYSLSYDALTSSNVTLDWFNLNNVKSGGVAIQWSPPDSLPLSPIIITSQDTYIAQRLSPNVQYTFTATPLNGASMPGSSISCNILTSAAVTNVIPILGANYASNIVYGGYSNLLISWSNLSLAQSPTYYKYVIAESNSSNTFITSNINADSLYTFSYQPYNNSNIPGALFVIPQVAAAATVGQIYVSAHTSRTVNVSWPTIGYSNHYVTIRYNGISSAPQYGSSYQITGLMPNTSYTINAIPVNIFNIENIYGQTSVNVCTYGEITAVGVDDNATLSAYNLNLNVTGTYSNAIVSYTSSSIASNITIVGPSTNLNISLPIYGLNANTPYTFSVAPYNTSNEIGSSFVSDVINTLSIINNVIATNIATNSFSIAWTSTGTYTNVEVDISPNPTIPPSYPILTSVNNPYTFGPPTYTFIPNSLYTLFLNPHGLAHIGSYYPYGIASPTIYINTLPIIGSLTSIVPTDTTVALSWTNVSYCNVNIYWSNNNYTQSYSNLPSSITNYTITNLTANTLYGLTIVPYNQTGLPGSAISQQFTTLTNLTNLTISMTADSPTVYTSTATFNCQGTFNSIKYYYTYNDYNGTAHTSSLQTINQQTPQNNVTITSGLAPNINYTFYIEPFSSTAIGVTQVVSKYSLPSLTAASITSYTDTTVTISWGSGSINDKYATITIQTTGSSLNSIMPITGLTTSPYTIQSLSPNTSYSLSVTPYNSDTPLAPGNTIILPSLVTYGNITGTPTYTVTTSTISNINIEGVYAYVVINYSGGQSSGHITQSALPSYVISGLNPDTYYGLLCSVYNSANQTPTTPRLVAVQTLAYVPMPPSYTSSTQTITLTWNKNASNYNYLVISWVPISGSSPAAIAGNSPHILYTTNDNGTYIINPLVNPLVSYTTYTITITAYNSANPVVANQLQSFNVTTLVYITSVTAQSVGTNTVTIQWVGQYYYVKVYNSYVTTQQKVTSGNSYQFNNNFNANTSYTFYVIPYDQNDNPGATVSAQIITLPNSIQNITSVLSLTAGWSTISTSWTSSYPSDYDHIIITPNLIVNGTSTPQTPSSSIVTSPALYSTLIANSYYTITVTPYNSQNRAGDSYTTAQILTLGLIRNLSILQSTTTNLKLQWDNGLFATVNIQVATGGSTIQYINNLIGNTYDFSDYLAPSTTYTISVFAVNSANVVNTEQSSVTNVVVGNTLPVINSFTITAVTTNSISVQWTGAFSKVDLTWLGDDGTQGSILGYTGSSVNTYTAGPALSVNMRYKFTLHPYNNAANPLQGDVKVLYATTLATLGPVTYGSPSINSVTASWSSGNYNYIVFSWTGTSTGNLNALTSPFPIIGLQTNGIYTITATPYNNNVTPLPGSALVSPLIYTLPLIDSFNITSVTARSMQLQWSGAYSYLNITWTGTGGPTSGTINNIPSSSNMYINNYLTPNSTYTYTLTAYNSANVANIFTPQNSGVLTATTLSG